MEPESHEHDVAGIDDLGPGESLAFSIECDGRSIPAFVINFADRFHAYVNQCRHVPLTLDWAENRFFTEDGRYLLCANHGAWYEPSTGECVAGPPCGQALFRIPFRVVNRRILVRCPPELVSSPSGPPGET
jgi:nitrite reductase/ring-hydroxylating ferredoxin subunit